jgi:hypothetical protein
MNRLIYHHTSSVRITITFFSFELNEGHGHVGFQPDQNCTFGAVILRGNSDANSEFGHTMMMLKENCIRTSNLDVRVIDQ